MYPSKILMVVAKENFRDEEYLEPKKVFAQDGYKVEVVSSSSGDCFGIAGTKVHADHSLAHVHAADYEAVVFVGGIGAKEFFSDPLAHHLAKEALGAGLAVGAICIAPSILANAGILKDKKVTAFESEKENLEKQGAKFTGADVEVDGNLVTANGPDAATEFAEKVVEQIK